MRATLCAWLLLLASIGRADPPGDLEKRIEAKIPSVAEFRVIREEAARRGLRIWLFGGTASSYAYYVKQDDGGPRFDYDFTNLYRSTQDLDLVVDGSANAAREFQDYLARRFPFFMGSKAAWEIRPLREAIGNKSALLGDFDFDNQHTDSASTGMIELTVPPSGEKAVRDLRGWNSPQPRFLADLANGEIHFYYSPAHDKTSLFKAGKNPPIFSVIRYLTKLFQYELKPREEDLAVVRGIIADFDPAKHKGDPELQRWMEKNGAKLYKHAVNLEYASDMLDKLGLKAKLAKIGDPEKPQTMAWWMQKAVLRSSGFGTEGKTAAELGITEVAHETNSFVSYESITRARTGDPNVFYSREKAPSEAAVYGDGFYTRVGKSGARGTGLTIRFTVDPGAREGTDFIYVREHHYVIFRNKRALRVIPESLDLDFLGYFEMLSGGDPVSNDDKALLEKFERKIASQLSTGQITKEQIDKVAKIVRAELKKPRPREIILSEWLKTPVAFEYPDIFQAYIASKRNGSDSLASEAVGVAVSGYVKSLASRTPWDRVIEALQRSPLTAIMEEIVRTKPLVYQSWYVNSYGSTLANGIDAAVGDIIAEGLLAPRIPPEIERFFIDIRIMDAAISGRKDEDSAVEWKALVETVRRAVEADPSFRPLAKDLLRSKNLDNAGRTLGDIFNARGANDRALEILCDGLAAIKGPKLPGEALMDGLERLPPAVKRRVSRILIDGWRPLHGESREYISSGDPIVVETALETWVRGSIVHESERLKLVAMKKRSVVVTPPKPLSRLVRRLYYSLDSRPLRLELLETAKRALASASSPEEKKSRDLVDGYLDREKNGGILSSSWFECMRAVGRIGLF